MAKDSQLQFEWDETNLRHLARHRISHSDFEQAMANDPVLVDFSDESGEERWYALGATDSLRVLFMVFTHRGERVRPITGWTAGRKLREAYFWRRGIGGNVMTKNKLIIPKFTSEREDARWHDRHRRELERAMERRIQEGSTFTAQPMDDRVRLRPVTIRLPTEDIDTARGLAAQKGIGYQTYIKMLLREALQREARRR